MQKSILCITFGGAIGRQLQLSTSFKHVTIAPDGTAIIKDQTRPGPGCSYQGSNAIFKCKRTQANSTFSDQGFAGGATAGSRVVDKGLVSSQFGTSCGDNPGVIKNGKITCAS